MIKFISKHPISVFLSVLLHIVIIAIFAVKWLEPDPIEVSMNLLGNEPELIKEVKQTPASDSLPTSEPLKTFAVDSTQVKAKLEQIKKEQEARIQEQKMLQQLTQKERERLKDLQKKQAVETAKAEQAKKQAEVEKQKIAEAKKLADVEKKKAEAERKKAEQAKLAAAEAEKLRKAEKEKAKQAELQRIAEEKKKQEIEQEVAQKAEEKKTLEQAAADAKKLKEQQEREAALQRQLAEEQAAIRAQQKAKQLNNLKAAYVSAIRAKVKDNWRTPAKFADDAQCDLRITQSPKGEITSVKVLNCNAGANRQFQQAAERAVYRAAPLPQPPVPEVFDREIKFVFTPY